MHPILRDRELLVVEPLGDVLPEKGDVIVFTSASRGHKVIHRVVGVHGNLVTTRGDNNDRTDAFRPGTEAIHGRVCAVCRGNRSIPVTGGKLGVVSGWFMRRRNSLLRLRSRIRNTISIPSTGTMEFEDGARKSV